MSMSTDLSWFFYKTISKEFIKFILSLTTISCKILHLLTSRLNVDNFKLNSQTNITKRMQSLNPNINYFNV